MYLPCEPEHIQPQPPHAKRNESSACVPKRSETQPAFVMPSQFRVAMPPLLLFLVTLLLLSAHPSVQLAICRSQTLPTLPRTGLHLALQNSSAFRSRVSPSHRGLSPEARSIVRCRRDVEVLSVPQTASAFEGVPLGAIVTIVETHRPLTHAAQIEQRALPAWQWRVCRGGLDTF